MTINIKLIKGLETDNINESNKARENKINRGRAAAIEVKTPVTTLDR